MNVTLEIRNEVYNFKLEYREYMDCLKYRDISRIIECVSNIFADKVTDEWVRAKIDWFRRVTPDDAWVHFRYSQGEILKELFLKTMVDLLCTLYESGFTEWRGREAVRRYRELFPEGVMVSFDYMSVTVDLDYEVYRTRPRVVRRHEVLIFRDLFRRRGYVCPEAPIPEEVIRERFQYTLDLIGTIEKYFPEYIYNIDFLAFQQWKEIRELFNEVTRTDAVLRFMREHNYLRRIEKPVRYIGALVDRSKHMFHTLGNRFSFARRMIERLVAHYGVRWFAGIVTRSLVFIDLDGKTLETFEEIGKLLVMLIEIYGVKNFIITETYRGFHIIGLKNLHKRDWLMLYRDLVLRNCNIPRELVEKLMSIEGVSVLPECTWKYVDFFHAWYSLNRMKSILRVSTTRTRYLRICMVIKDLKVVEDRVECPTELRVIVRRVLSRYM